MNPYEYVERQKDKVQYTSVERVIEMIKRDYKFLPDINISDVLEWTGTVYGLINYPGLFREKITGEDITTPHIKISDHRGELPLDFKRVLHAGVRDHDNKEVYRTASGTFTKFNNSLGESPTIRSANKVYDIKGGYIFTDDKDATLEMAYEAFPIDERGYPLVPSDERVLQYIKEYIASKVAFNELAARKIDKFIYDEIETNRMWRAGSAATSVINPTADMMETWTWSRLKLTARFGFGNSFTTQADREDLTLGTN